MVIMTKYKFDLHSLTFGQNVVSVFYKVFIFSHFICFILEMEHTTDFECPLVHYEYDKKRQKIGFDLRSLTFGQSVVSVFRQVTRFGLE